MTDTRLDRREVVKRLLAERGELVVVSGLGSATYDVAAAEDHQRNFYLWGAMGGTVALALGLALARPKTPILAVTGDGDMLMGVGSLATVAVKNPGNLSIIVLDNGVYGETGMQQTHTALGADLARIAEGCGIRIARRLTRMNEIDGIVPSLQQLSGGPRFYAVAVSEAEHPRVLPARDGVFLKNRLRAAFALPPV